MNIDTEKGHSILVDIPSGKYNSIRFAKVLGGSVKTTDIPRRLISDIISNTKIQIPSGVYLFLAGGREDNDKQNLFIGDNINLRSHISRCDLTSDRWQSLMVIEVADEYAWRLHKDITAVAMQIGLFNIRSVARTQSGQPELNEVGERLFEEACLCLEALGVYIQSSEDFELKEPPSPAVTVDKPNSNKANVGHEIPELDKAYSVDIANLRKPKAGEYAELLHCKSSLGASAYAYARPDDSVCVLKGSLIRNQGTKSFKDRDHSSYKIKRSLLRKGKLTAVNNNESYKLLEDVQFNKPSGASSFVLATPSSGNHDFKLVSSSERFGDVKDKASFRASLVDEQLYSTKNPADSNAAQASVTDTAVVMRPPKDSEYPELFYCKSEQLNVEAYGYLDADLSRFTILQGSKVKLTPHKNVKSAIAKERANLIRKGVLSLSVDADAYIFTEDTTIKSSIWAATIVRGARSSNMYWETQDGRNIVHIRSVKNQTNTHNDTANERVVKRELSNPPLGQVVICETKGDGYKLLSKGVLNKDGSFTLLKGSSLSLFTPEPPVLDQKHSRKKIKLATSGVLAVQYDWLRMEEDYTFDSISEASSIVLGRDSDGLGVWDVEQSSSL